jgi:hypothetical protein
MAGVARLHFPITAGTPLGGYAARTGPATGTLDPLTVGALVLERDDARLAIVAADVVAVDAALGTEVAAAAGLDRSQVALCASHTHSGPAGIVVRLHPADPDRLDPALRARFVATAADAIAAARVAAEPVAVLFGATETEGLATNRNDPAAADSVRCSVLATKRRDGTIQAALVHFPCHPTILGADNRRVSADFPGALRRVFETTRSPGAPSPLALFINGAAGDISTRFTRRGQDPAEVARIGAALAAEAVIALSRARALDGPLRYARATVNIAPHPRQPAVTAESAEVVAATAASNHGLQRQAETRAQGAAMLAALAAVPGAALPAALGLEAWALGDLVLLAMPGELFASLGQRIAAAAGTPPLILGYTNGYVGYLADRAAHAAGTYEALASRFGPEAGDRVVAAASSLIATVATRQTGRSGDADLASDRP